MTVNTRGRTKKLRESEIPVKSPLNTPVTIDNGKWTNANSKYAVAVALSRGKYSDLIKQKIHKKS
jgi:hypothetical protein